MQLPMTLDESSMALGITTWLVTPMLISASAGCKNRTPSSSAMTCPNICLGILCCPDYEAMTASALRFFSPSHVLYFKFFKSALQVQDEEDTHRNAQNWRCSFVASYQVLHTL